MYTYVYVLLCVYMYVYMYTYMYVLFMCVHVCNLPFLMCNCDKCIINRYPIQPATESVDSLIQVSDSVLCAGGMDGKIR